MFPRWFTTLIYYFSFHGRLPRKEFWKLYTINCLLGIVALFFSVDAISVYLTGEHLLLFFVFSISMLPHFLESEQVAGIFMFTGAISLTVLMVVTFSLLSVLVRRLHDISLSAWTLFLLVFVSPPIILFLIIRFSSHFSTTLFLYVVVMSMLASLIGFIPGFRGRNMYGDEFISVHNEEIEEASYNRDY